jgi:hypothetical protein
MLGSVALVDIARNRGRSAGFGYALFGILGGLVFTGLTVFTITKGEWFEAAGGKARRYVLRSQVDYGGPLEIVKAAEGFAITRPSWDWGVAKADMARGMAPDSKLVLLNLEEDASIDITVDEVGPGQSLKQHADRIEAAFQDPSGRALFGPGESGLRVSGYKLRQRHTLPADGNVEREELLLDVKIATNSMTFLIRLFKARGTTRAYVVRARAPAGRFAHVEADMRRALDSFRLLGHAAGVP